MLRLGRVGQSSLVLGGGVDSVMIYIFVEYPHFIGFWCSTTVNLACDLALCPCPMSVSLLILAILAPGTTIDKEWGRRAAKGGGGRIKRLASVFSFVGTSKMLVLCLLFCCGSVDRTPGREEEGEPFCLEDDFLFLSLSWNG